MRREASHIELGGPESDVTEWLFGRDEPIEWFKVSFMYASLNSIQMSLIQEKRKGLTKPGKWLYSSNFFVYFLKNYHMHVGYMYMHV